LIQMIMFQKITVSNAPGYNIRMVLFGALATLLLSVPLLAAESGIAFRIQSAEFNLNETLLELNSEIEIELPTYINTAIEKGFAVPMMFEVEILSVKKYWLDEKIVSLKQQYQLHYLPMLSSYVIFDLNAGQRYYFDQLNQAVHYLQVVYNYPMLDIDNIDDNRSFYARIRFGIDGDELPLPLKSSSLWDNDWSLRSDWYEWDIEKSSYE